MVSGSLHQYAILDMTYTGAVFWDVAYAGHSVLDMSVLDTVIWEIKHTRHILLYNVVCTNCTDVY